MASTSTIPSALQWAPIVVEHDPADGTPVRVSDRDRGQPRGDGTTHPEHVDALASHLFETNLLAVQPPDNNPRIDTLDPHQEHPMRSITPGRPMNTLTHRPRTGFQELVRRRPRQRDPRLTRLTEREVGVLALMAEGLGNSAIADRLFVTDGAIHKHVRNIFAKLDLAPDDQADRRVAAVLRYLDAGPIVRHDAGWSPRPQSAAVRALPPVG